MGLNDESGFESEYIIIYLFFIVVLSFLVNNFYFFIDKLVGLYLVVVLRVKR